MAKNRLFSNDTPYEGRYTRKQTEAQKQAARANIKEWNRLRSEYGLEKAKKIAARRRDLKQTFKDSNSSVPKSEKDAHDRFKAIMNTLDEADRQKFREEYDSLAVLEVGSKWLEEGDWDEDQYMDADEAEELLIAWETWMAE